jgi:two-component system, NarL family, response regulator DevR
VRILIVDDTDLIRNLIRDLLTSLPFPTCIVEAADVPQALGILGQWHPDVVTLDLQLPGGSGLNVLQAIKQAGLHSRVIVLTSLTEPRIRQACLEEGAAFVLDKSSDLEQLPNILRTVADPRQNS